MTSGLSPNRPITATLTAGTWSVAAAPLPADADPQAEAWLYSISCPVAGSCAAVGYYSTTGGRQLPLVVSLAGGVWSAATTQLPGNADGSDGGSLTSVSCVSATSCATTGSYHTSSAHQAAFAVSLVSGAWTGATGLTPPAGVISDREVSNFVDCSGATCVASVNSDNGGDGGAYLAVLSAGVWTMTTPPLPAGGSQLLSLSGVSCASSTACTVVGQYFDNSISGGTVLDHQHGLVETLTGGTWVASGIGVDTDGIDVFNLFEVDCPSPSFCAVTGIGVDDYPELLTGADDTWTATPAPLPVDAAHPSSPSSVSCASPDACVAIGTYLDQANHVNGLLEVYANGDWAASAGARPSLAPDQAIAPEAVSCQGSHSFCVAVGSLEPAASTLALTNSVETYVLPS